MKVNAVYTESAARAKWCPFANVYVRYQNTGAVGNRGLSKDDGMQDSEVKARCIASRCMAWRWHTTHIKDPDNPEQTIESADTYGFCGLAGPV